MGVFTKHKPEGKETTPSGFVVICKHTLMFTSYPQQCKYSGKNLKLCFLNKWAFQEINHSVVIKNAHCGAKVAGFES